MHDMATSSSKSARAATGKPSKEEVKAAKAVKKAESKQRRKQLWMVFKQQIKTDKRLLPYLILTLLGTAGIITLLAWLTGVKWWMGLIFGVLIGVMAAMIVFARRVQRSVYEQAEGQPGAAAWSLQNNLKGKWRVTQTVAATTHMDAVHRVIGRPGVVLIGEGAPQRVGPLMAQEKKRIARVLRNRDKTIYIYTFIVGTGDDEVRLRKLNSTLMKLPRNISNAEVNQLETQLSALANRSPQVGLPKGPLPAGAKMRSIQRTARRHSGK